MHIFHKKSNTVARTLKLYHTGEKADWVNWVEVVYWIKSDFHLGAVQQGKDAPGTEIWKHEIMIVTKIMTVLCFCFIKIKYISINLVAISICSK